ncbi:conserved hypothetical protein [uncultured Pleomorphomonas sp.]|uniref:Helix-turn-helix domain-containing protein n=1 Tax=uncultured Pleomorphomonas sp. TaxID=442121 RepID=A0A212L7L1_9HYPH|nr:conserved hypothetical protein [uncultured Pleomorphomonas sp.]
MVREVTMPDASVLDRAFADQVLITPAEAARLLGISGKTLQAAVRRGQITYRTIGGGDVRQCRRFAREDIDAFMERVKCRSIDQRAPVAAPKARSTNMTSKSTVIAFSELQKQRAGATPKPSRKS